MAFGTSSQTINSARVSISRGNQEVSLISDLRLQTTRVSDRVNTRAGAIDSFRWVREEATFTAQLTDLLLEQIKTDSAIDGNSKMIYNNWTISGIAISGTAADNISETKSATLIEYDIVAGENGLSTVNIKLLVAGGAL